MDALENILNRVSARTLAEPFPSKDEMNTVYKAALRARSEEHTSELQSHS